MANLVSKPAPDFQADAVMPDGSFKAIKLSAYKGKYVVLFFYPLQIFWAFPGRLFNVTFRGFPMIITGRHVGA